MPRSIHRRTVLRGMFLGAAASVALPVLEQFLNGNGTAFANGAPLPTRFVLMFWGCGTRISQWLPARTGTSYPLSPVLAPYAPVQDYLSVVSGTRCRINGLVHHFGAAGVLSAAEYVRAGSGTGTTFGAPSFDQVVAQEIGSSTRFRSLEVGVLTPTKKDEGSTLQHLSHNGPNDVNPAEASPERLFRRLFGDSTLTGTYGSVLDAVLDDLRALRAQIGAADRQRLDAYTTQVRSIESALSADGASGPLCTPAISPGTDVPMSALSTAAAITARSGIMWSLITAALACDLTRVVSVQYSGASDCIQLPRDVFADLPLLEGGQKPLANDLTHGMTHNESTFDQPVVARWSTFYQAQFSNFLQAMKATPDGAANLLDNSAVMITSEVSQGRNHSSLHMPMLIAGRASGRLVHPGIHYAANGMAPSFTPAPTPANTYDAAGDITTDGARFGNCTDAHLTVLRALGIDRASYGSGAAASSTPIGALLA